MRLRNIYKKSQKFSRDNLATFATEASEKRSQNGLKIFFVSEKEVRG
jgi:hypothetical protein